MIRNSGLIKMKLLRVFGEEFGQDVEPTSIITEYMKDEASVVLIAVGDEDKWIVNFWSESYAANFFGIWNRIPTMEDVTKFWDITFPGDAAEIIEPLKLEGLCSEAEERLIPEDVSQWEKFFSHYM